jgi:hypothetical protein
MPFKPASDGGIAPASAPVFGADTVAVLCKRLGLSTEEADPFRVAEALGKLLFTKSRSILI